MIVGYHIIFGMYGFWLPNDPRGSWSQFVGSRELYRVGPATKTTERRSLAYRQHNLTQRLEAKKKLEHPAVMLTGIQARAVGRGFARYFSRWVLRRGRVPFCQITSIWWSDAEDMRWRKWSSA